MVYRTECLFHINDKVILANPLDPESYFLTNYEGIVTDVVPCDTMDSWLVQVQFSDSDDGWFLQEELEKSGL